MKKILELNSLTYFIIFIIVLVLPLSFVAVGSYLMPQLNLLAVKTYFTYYGGISLSFTAILSLILTHFYLKKNFKDTKAKIDFPYLLKINLIFIIFSMFITITSSLINYFHISNYFVYALYLFYPLIYFCLILFLEPKKLKRNEVIITLIIIYSLWYFLVPLIVFLIRNGMHIKSVLYMLLYNFLQFTLLVMPFMSLGLHKIAHENKDKSIVNKYNFSIPKLIILSLVLLGITLSVIVILR